jgi:uncharacterized protein YggE
MKKIAVAVVLIAGAVLAQGSSIPDFPFVFAMGRAEKEVPPDTAKMTFHIKAFHEVSSNAVAKVTQRSIEVINFLGKQGFGKGSLVTYELSKNEVRERKEYQELKILGYEATRRFELTFDDLSKYDLVARTLFKTDDVSDISTTFGRKDQKEIEAALLGDACADAKRNAAAMAAGFGKAVGAVHCISKQGFGNIGVVFGLGADAFDSGGIMACMAGPDEDAFLFMPATIKYQNQVSVLFKLEKK